MPIYEFQCGRCNHVFEVLCRASDEKHRASCTRCASKKTKKLMSVCRTKVERSPYEMAGRAAGSGSGSCGSCSATSCSTCGH
jgi:putative FmdB family regulatory protein